MGVPCTPVSTVEVAAGDGISVTLLGGVYTVSVDSDTAAALSNYKIYATQAARDLDNPSPSSGDAAWSQADDRLWWHDGTGWVIMREPEQTYTPTWANVTLGTSPTRTGRYRRMNGMIWVGGNLALGTGGSVTSQPTMSMPSGITLAAAKRGMLQVNFLDSGTAGFRGEIEAISLGASTIAPLVFVAGGTYLGHANLASTVPMTWTTADECNVLDGWLVMQTPYL